MGLRPANIALDHIVVVSERGDVVTLSGRFMAAGICRPKAFCITVLCTQSLPSLNTSIRRSSSVALL